MARHVQIEQVSVELKNKVKEVRIRQEKEVKDKSPL